MIEHEKKIEEGAAATTQYYALDAMIRLTILRISACEGASENNGVKVKEAIIELIIMILGPGTNKSNIEDRFIAFRDSADDRLDTVLNNNGYAENNRVIDVHIAFAQRIIVTALGRYIPLLKKSWLEKYSDNKPDDISALLILKKYLSQLVFYFSVLPNICLLSEKRVLSVEMDLDCSMYRLLNSQTSGTATITLDLRAPKESLMSTFEQFVDEAKDKMRAIPGNEMMLNLYDFTRKKDGRKNKFPYKHWKRAIIDFEDCSEYWSVEQAAGDLSMENEDPGTVRKNLENHSKRFNSLLNAVMNNTFPKIAD